MESPVAARAGAPGVLAGLAGVMRNIVGLMVARLELAALELAELRQHAMALLLVALLALMSTAFAILCASALVVALNWERMGWRILLVLLVVYTATALALVLRLRTMLRQDRLALTETMSEFRADRELLR